ncbi:MAG: potassium-transporting ATPase subunit KdpB [Gammaproteobacteria bacterium]|jgi:K+-transporting ATPase ATPase B chain|nr:potassium-transporting ATPase subunit KdpB [Gammaproteobacteria bacterium]
MTTEKKKKITKSAIFPCLLQAILHLTPQHQIKNPVMFVTYIGCLLTTFIYGYSLFSPVKENSQFILQITLWLWFTVIFANFSESIAERRGKAQAETLKKARREVQAKKIKSIDDKNFVLVPATQLHYDDIVLVEAGDVIPGDGQVIRGVASVDESAITGESAPVIRESGADRDSVTGGTVVLSDCLIIRITSNPGETFLERMISLVECAKRQKTPNEVALSILLAGMSLIFLIVVMTLLPFSLFSIERSGHGIPVTVTILVSLLVCLIPTTIGGLLSAIGIAGMDRLIQNNVIATSGRAVEAAGDVSILLLDKTGTITIGNRQAIAFYPARGITIDEIAQAAEVSSLADETPEGKSIVQLARGTYNVNPTDISQLTANFIPFSAETRMSGIEIDGQQIVKGAVDKIVHLIQSQNGTIDDTIIKKVEDISRAGSTPLLILNGVRMLGAVELKDIIKPGIKERLAELRLMGIKSIMITGDNALTAATIGNEAGVDDFHAEATPEIKLKLIRKFQENGQLVAMVGDGTNDAPALAQTDVAVAMNSGTQAAKEAANMVDLDSDPTKLIEIVKIGKQLLITRGALTTFSISNDVAKYFAIIPAAFANTVPGLKYFNIMHLSSAHSAILSAVIFNALSIIFLIPLALRGVKYRAATPDALLLRNTLIYGLGGLIIPFFGIKFIDLLIKAVSLI